MSTSPSKADVFFLNHVSDAERILRRTPASAARLDGELHTVLVGAADRTVTCPHCKNVSGPWRVPGQDRWLPPDNVMFECLGCGDGLVVLRGGP